MGIIDRGVPVRPPSGSSGSRGIDSVPGSSAMVSRVVLELVTERLGEERADAVLERAGLQTPKAELMKFGHRLSYGEKVRLMEAAAVELEDPRFGLELGSIPLHAADFGPLRALCRTMGSPEWMLRQVSQLAARLDTSVVVSCSAERGRASLYRRVLVDEGVIRADCDWLRGLIAQIPPLFGLPPAEVAHHVCQVDGADACLYELRWRVPRRSRFFRRRPGATVADDLTQLLGADDRLLALQGAADDMVASGTVPELLDRMITRVDSVVHAPSHVLAVRLPDGAVHTRFRGMGADFQEALLDGVDLDHTAPSLLGRPVLSVPVASANRHFGTLTAVGEPGQGYFDADDKTLTAYAKHAAAGLEMSVLLTEAREQRRSSELLLDVARSLSLHSSVDAVAQNVADAVPYLLHTEISAIVTWETDDRLDILCGAESSVLLDEWVQECLAELLGRPDVRAKLAEGSPISIDPDAGALEREAFRRLAVETVVLMPIGAGSEFAGVLVACWRKTVTVDSAILEPLAGLAGLAAITFESAMRAEADRFQALHDPLTGLANRRLFEERLTEELARSDDGGLPLGVVFCDINRFKRINDTLGHPAGDEVLQIVADRLRGAVRDGDTVARLSGDEFVLLLPDVESPAEVVRVADRVRGQLRIPMTVGGTEMIIGVAVGTAMSDEHDDQDTDSFKRILQLADSRMYRAKASHGTGRPAADASVETSDPAPDLIDIA